MPMTPGFLQRSNWLRPRLCDYCERLVARLEADLDRRVRALQTRDTCQSWGAFISRLSLTKERQRRNVCRSGAGDGTKASVATAVERSKRLAEQLMERRLRSLPLTQGKLSEEARQQLAQFAYQLAVKLISHFDNMDQSAALLNASACLGHCSAKFLLSAMLSYGLQSDRHMDFTESNALLLENVLRCRHQLSLLALATKHYLGSDGAEANRELSLAYFFHLARRTPSEKDELANEEYNRVDMVRLTDENRVKEVTHAEDDLFQWISHQAGRGVPWAKRKMADLLYWGSSGMQRNVQEGLSYFKKAADEDGSAGAAHDYGMLLIKGGHGSHRVREGLQYLQRAAQLTNERDPRTLTSLGWYAERHEGDMAKAIDLYKRAAALGGHDAVYNL
uniref:TPR_REGION domain-containing protein n=1 Tax=Macrostomum lignano TaxID=282301 RepID=A0A1I8G1B9_9PLAT